MHSFGSSGVKSPFCICYEYSMMTLPEFPGSPVLPRLCLQATSCALAFLAGQIQAKARRQSRAETLISVERRSAMQNLIHMGEEVLKDSERPGAVGLGMQSCRG